MDRLKIQYEQLLKAYGRLEYMSKIFLELSAKPIPKNPDENSENDLITHRDALIQRFEFCYDLTWKFFKQLLNARYGLEVLSPRKVFEECYQQNILTRDETETFTKMIDIRNNTSHVYDETMADKVSKEIVQYYDFFIKTLKKIDL